jgi:hypothetical protein
MSEQRRMLSQARQDEARAEREAAEIEAARVVREAASKAAAEARQVAVRESMREQLQLKEQLRAEERERDAAEATRAAREASLSLAEADLRAKRRVEKQVAYALELAAQAKLAEKRKEMMKSDPAAEATFLETLLRDQQEELAALKEETIREIRSTIESGCLNVSQSQRDVLLTSLVRKANKVRI